MLSHVTDASSWVYFQSAADPSPSCCILASTRVYFICQTSLLTRRAITMVSKTASPLFKIHISQFYWSVIWRMQLDSKLSYLLAIFLSLEYKFCGCMSALQSIRHFPYAQSRGVAYIWWRVREAAGTLKSFYVSAFDRLHHLACREDNYLDFLATSSCKFSSPVKLIFSLGISALMQNRLSKGFVGRSLLIGLGCSIMSNS